MAFTFTGLAPSGHDDDGAHAKQLRGIGHGLAVVAGGSCHYAALALRRARWAMKLMPPRTKAPMG